MPVSNLVLYTNVPAALNESMLGYSESAISRTPSLLGHIVLVGLSEYCLEMEIRNVLICQGVYLCDPLRAQLQPCRTWAPWNRQESRLLRTFPVSDASYRPDDCGEPVLQHGQRQDWPGRLWDAVVFDEVA